MNTQLKVKRTSGLFKNSGYFYDGIPNIVHLFIILKVNK